MRGPAPGLLFAVIVVVGTLVWGRRGGARQRLRRVATVVAVALVVVAAVVWLDAVLRATHGR